MLRVATFNIENLDDPANPTLDVRVPVLRSMLARAHADILCLQEVHGQELDGHTPSAPKRDLTALKRVIEGTEYERFFLASTAMSKNVPYDKRNLVILSRYRILESRQYNNDFIDPLRYRRVTARPKEDEAVKIGWERPVFYARLDVPGYGPLHVINLHLKSKLATRIPGQDEGSYAWRSPAGWAEGFFLSSIKRVGQALETRVLLDELLEADPGASIIVCGDLNAEPHEVPVEAIAGRVENTDNPDLRHLVLVACSRSIPETVRFSHYHHGHGNLLDHMLVSQALLPHFRGAEIYNENLHDESLKHRYDTKYPESDHAPFVAEFDIGGC